jgi:hypothetical protein
MIPPRRAFGVVLITNHSNRIRKDRPAKSNPVFETDHRRPFGKVRSRQTEQECRGLCPARDRSAISRVRCEFSVKVNRIAVTGGARVFRNAFRCECDFGRESLIGPNIHNCCKSTNTESRALTIS